MTMIVEIYYKLKLYFLQFTQMDISSFEFIRFVTRYWTKVLFQVYHSIMITRIYYNIETVSFLCLPIEYRLLNLSATTKVVKDRSTCLLLVQKRSSMISPADRARFAERERNMPFGWRSQCRGVSGLPVTSRKLARVRLKDSSKPSLWPLFLSASTFSLFSSRPTKTQAYLRPRVIRVIREIRMKSFAPSQRVPAALRRRLICTRTRSNDR